MVHHIRNHVHPTKAWNLSEVFFHMIQPSRITMVGENSLQFISCESKFYYESST